MTNASDQPQTVYLADYRSPDFLIDQVELRFELDEMATRVNSVMTIRRNNGAEGRPLVLSGRELSLVSVRLDGRTMDAGEYEVTIESLTISRLPNEFTLEVVTDVNPLVQ